MPCPEVAANMSEFLKFPMARGVRIGRSTALQPKEEAKDKTIGKRPGHVGTSGRTKKRKIAPLSMALSESEAKGSPGRNQALQSDGRVEEQVVDASNNNETILKKITLLTLHLLLI
ncbi:hypothetical protein Tco_1229881 [Tanacetum coccineum]